MLFVRGPFQRTATGIRWKTVIWGVVLQSPWGRRDRLAGGGAAAENRSRTASRGDSLLGQGRESSSAGFRTRARRADRKGDRRRLSPFIFAFKVMPIVIFIASFFTILYYLGIMQRVVQVFAVVMTKLSDLGSGALAVAATSSWPDRSATSSRPTSEDDELRAATMMTGGMAHIRAPCARYARWGSLQLLITRVGDGRPCDDRHGQAPPPGGGRSR